MYSALLLHYTSLLVLLGLSRVLLDIIYPFDKRKPFLRKHPEDLAGNAIP